MSNSSGRSQTCGWTGRPEAAQREQAGEEAAVPDLRVAIAGAEADLHPHPPGDHHPLDLDVLGRQPREDRVGRTPAQGLVDRRLEQAAVVTALLPEMIVEHCYIGC